jgi:Ca2+-binding RTX toxin-like protein
MGAVDVARTQSTAFQITEDIEGTSTPDVLNGAGYGDKIYGLSGNDIVSGAAGDGGLYIQNSHGRTLQRNIMYDRV